MSYSAVFDTGATLSAISRRVVLALRLVAVDKWKIHHAGGTSERNVYAVNITLPNGISFGSVEVVRCKLTGCDALMGIEIISRGDLAISKFQAETLMSFRYSSAATTDYEASQHQSFGSVLIRPVRPIRHVQRMWKRPWVSHHTPFVGDRAELLRWRRSVLCGLASVIAFNVLHH
jgi:hypothetical protein